MEPSIRSPWLSVACRYLKHCFCTNFCLPTCRSHMTKFQRQSCPDSFFHRNCAEAVIVRYVRNLCILSTLHQGGYAFGSHQLMYAQRTLSAEQRSQQLIRRWQRILARLFFYLPMTKTIVMKGFLWFREFLVFKTFQHQFENGLFQLFRHRNEYLAK